MRERLYYMDILRLAAILLVMFAHFVLVGTFATSIPGIIDTAHNDYLPLLNGNNWKFWVFDQKLIEIFHTQSGILGVLIFFLITGYLITAMQSRYSRKDFIINRFFRIFPALLFCVLLVGYFVYLTQGIKFSFASYIASITLSYEFLMVVPVIGVLWTLIIEMLFYIIAFIIGKFNRYNLLFLQTILLIIIYQSIINENIYVNIAATYCRYILFILIGVAIKLSESEEDYFRKLTIIISSIFFSYLGFKIYKFGHDDTSTYNHIGSQLLAFTIFYLLYNTQKYTLKFFRKLPILYKIADLTYPLYLLHAAIGLGSIYFIRDYFDNQYVVVLLAIVISCLFAIVIHILIEKPGIAFGKFLINKLQD